MIVVIMAYNNNNNLSQKQVFICFDVKKELYRFPSTLLLDTMHPLYQRLSTGLLKTIILSLLL